MARNRHKKSASFAFFLGGTIAVSVSILVFFLNAANLDTNCYKLNDTDTYCSIEEHRVFGTKKKFLCTKDISHIDIVKRRSGRSKQETFELTLNNGSVIRVNQVKYNTKELHLYKDKFQKFLKSNKSVRDFQMQINNKKDGIFYCGIVGSIGLVSLLTGFILKLFGK